jgi:hypothetical protein
MGPLLWRPYGGRGRSYGRETRSLWTGVGMLGDIYLYKDTGQAPDGAGVLARAAEPHGSQLFVDIGVFSPWPSSIGAGDKFLCSVPGPPGGQVEWLEPDAVEVVSSFVDPSAELGLVAFKTIAKVQPPTVTGPLTTAAQVANLFNSNQGRWVGVVQATTPQLATTTAAQPPTSGIAGPPVTLPTPPSFARVSTNVVSTYRSLLCILLRRAD